MRDRYQLDVHQSDSANAERECADEAHENLEPERNDFELVHLGHDVENLDGLMVALIEFVRHGENCAHGLLQAFVLRSLVIKPDGVEIMRVFEVGHGGERDVHHAVYVAVALLHFRTEDPDHFET